MVNTLRMNLRLGNYKLHMLKIQKLMVDAFGVEAKSNDMISDMADLAAKQVTR